MFSKFVLPIIEVSMAPAMLSITEVIMVEHARWFSIT